MSVISLVCLILLSNFVSHLRTNDSSSLGVFDRRILYELSGVFLLFFFLVLEWFLWFTSWKEYKSIYMLLGIIFWQNEVIKSQTGQKENDTQMYKRQRLRPSRRVLRAFRAPPTWWTSCCALPFLHRVSLVHHLQTICALRALPKSFEVRHAISPRARNPLFARRGCCRAK